MISFEVRLDWEITEQEETLIVSGVQGRFLSEIKDGHPDQRRPAEGGELEDIEIMDKDGVLLPMKIQDALLSDASFLEAIERRIEKCF